MSFLTSPFSSEPRLATSYLDAEQNAWFPPPLLAHHQLNSIIILSRGYFIHDTKRS